MARQICILWCSLCIYSVWAGVCELEGVFEPITDASSRFYGQSCDAINQGLGLTLRNAPGQQQRLINTSIPIPTSWDWRNEAPQCVQVIRDQQTCGGCWAFASVRTLAWRFCIFAFPNASSPVLSPQYLIDCDNGCYPAPDQDTCDAGCSGGYLDLAWRFLNTNGTVLDSVSPFTDKSGTCSTSRISLQQSGIYRSLDSYVIAQGNVTDIQRELLEYGPVTAGMEVFMDFLKYTSGVYVQTSDQVMGGHAVTLLGWGMTDAGENYWIAENQWGAGWGEQGYFRIRLGTDEVNIEDYVHAGRPNITGVAFPSLSFTQTINSSQSADVSNVAMALHPLLLGNPNPFVIVPVMLLVIAMIPTVRTWCDQAHPNIWSDHAIYVSVYLVLCSRLTIQIVASVILAFMGRL